MEQARSKSVGRFELTQLLGHEGRVSVYLAHDPHLDRKLTIRIADFSDLDTRFRERFDRRVRAMAELRHTHLSTVLDFGQADGVDFLATTYIDGDSLTEVVRANVGIEPKQVVLLVGKLALAINHMHGSELIHGFLSPDSVLLEKGGEPVIADLGLAPEFRSSQDDESSAFRSEFVAPEVSVSGGEDATPASDVYSLAAIGFFVITGSAPKSADDVYGTNFLRGVDGEWVDLFKQTFAKALAFSALDRYETARGLAAAMDQLYRATPLLHPAGSVAAATGGSNVAEFLQFDFQQIDGSHVVHLRDESVRSMEALAETKRELFAMVEQFDPKRLIINFASVRYCSSETVGILIQLKTEIKVRDTQLYLCGMRDSIREVFRVLNLDGSVFEIRGTVTNALKSVE